MRRLSAVSRWDLLDERAFDAGLDATQVAIILIFSEAQGRRCRTRKSRLAVPVLGMRRSVSGPCRSLVMTDGS